jgi:hypothetical protein
MKGGFVAAWLAGTGIVAWRMVHQDHHLPVPGALLGVTALFGALALVADVFPASAGVVTVTAWGLDVAALLNVLPAGLGGQVTQAQAAERQALNG